MAGRGRGRGKPIISMPSDQSGIAKEIAQAPQVLQPPPNYPPLLYKPLPFAITTELSYLFELKRDYSETMRESEYNVQPVVVKKDIERYSDRYLTMDTAGYESSYDWIRMPAELKPFGKKRKIEDTNGTSKKKKKEVNIEEKLKELETKEINQLSDAEEETKEKDENEEKDPDDVVEVDEEDIDEEMDDGTDYVNNYFDNGEGYDEEEEMDDGPTY